MNEENVNGGGDMAPVTEEQPNLVEEVVVEESVTLLDDLRREEVVPQQPEVVQPELAPLLLDWSGVVIPQPDAELLLKPEIIASLDVDLLPPPPPVASQEPVNWEERCALLERQVSKIQLSPVFSTSSSTFFPPLTASKSRRSHYFAQTAHRNSRNGIKKSHLQVETVVGSDQ